MTRRVLLIAYHFPPLAGSSGIQRSLRFAQHLPACGWEPLILTAHPRAYEKTSADLLADVPRGLIVRRAFALDTARHLALFGRYPGRLARPDRWMSWRFDAVRQGMRMIETYRPQVIWSTYPIATAHEIGAELQRRSKLPWIADFRDPMAQPEYDYPADPRTRAHFHRIEARVFGQAVRCVFTTPGAARIYRERFPAYAERVVVIENGYDEESFANLGVEDGAAPLSPGKITLLHSGIIYPGERDPRAFLDALAQLRDAGGTQRLCVRLRAAVHDEFLRREIAARGLEEIVELAPPIPYREALAEMLRADALLLMQAASCNEQIPAKLYEYLRAGRPILGLTDAAGDTAAALSAAGIRSIAPLDRPEAIASALLDLIARIEAGQAQGASAEAIAGASRAGRTQALASLLNQAAGAG